MGCPLRPYLGLFLDDRRGELKSHLQACPDCKEYLDGRALLGVLRPEDFVAGGEVLEEHPPVNDLRAYPDALTEPAREGVAKHLIECNACALIVADLMKARAKAEGKPDFHALLAEADGWLAKQSPSATEAVERGGAAKRAPRAASWWETILNLLGRKSTASDVQASRGALPDAIKALFDRYIAGHNDCDAVRAKESWAHFSASGLLGKARIAFSAPPPVTQFGSVEAPPPSREAVALALIANALFELNKRGARIDRRTLEKWLKDPKWRKDNISWLGRDPKEVGQHAQEVFDWLIAELPAGASPDKPPQA